MMKTTRRGFFGMLAAIAAWRPLFVRAATSTKVTRLRWDDDTPFAGTIINNAPEHLMIGRYETSDESRAFDIEQGQMRIGGTVPSKRGGVQAVRIYVSR